jgi:hypothetical protein
LTAAARVARYIPAGIGLGTDVMRSLWVERSRTITSWCADRLTALLTATLTAVLTDELAARTTFFGSTITVEGCARSGSSQQHSQQPSQQHSQIQVTALWMEGLGQSDARGGAAPVVVDGPAHGHDRVWRAMGEDP